MVAQLWFDIRNHRRTAIIFLGLWLISWALTVTVWQYDTSGYSLGMGPISIWPHFILPLVTGGLSGWWQGGPYGKPAIVRFVWVGAIAGALFAAVNWAILLAWSGFLVGIGSVRPDQGLSVVESLFEALHLGVTYIILGLILGAVGGLMGGLISSGRTAHSGHNA